MSTLFCATICIIIIIYFILVVKDTSLQILLSSGTVFMPPKWSLGYQQCRWSYLSDQRVLEVLRLLLLALNSDEPGINSICICRKLELEMLNMTCIPSSDCCWLLLLSFPSVIFWIRVKGNPFKNYPVRHAVCLHLNMQDVWGFFLCENSMSMLVIDQDI